MSTNGIRHFLDLIDIPRKQLREMIEKSRALKKGRRGAAGKGPLAGKTMAMIFDRPSTRTRVSFDVAIRCLIALDCGDEEIAGAFNAGSDEIIAMLRRRACDKGYPKPRPETEPPVTHDHRFLRKGAGPTRARF